MSSNSLPPRSDATQPRRLFLTLLAIIFGVEAIVMAILTFLPKMPEATEAVVDALLLAVLSAPLIWWVVAQPLRKAAEAERLGMEARLVGIIEGSRDAIIALDERFEVILFNHGAEQIFGYSADEILGQPLDILLPEGARGRHEKKMREFAGGSAESRAMTDRPLFYGRRKDGSTFPAEVSISKSVRGSATIMTAILRDVTQRLAIEAELRAARDKAEEATRAKSQFLANMSHELRTPMNAVIGMTGLLLETKLDEEQREQVETIRTSGDSLLTIINDILDFSKIESGGLELESRPFALRDCVRGSIDMLAGSAAQKGITLHARFADDVPELIVGDVARLRQVLLNLLSNAVKFTPRGEVELSVSAKDLGENRVKLSLAVRDTGIGIPPDRLDRLFRSFSQVDASTTRLYGGTGLGLAISKRLVEAMGGTIRVESAVGQGSTFSVTFSAYRAENSARRPSDAPKAIMRADFAKERPMRILLAEDNAVNQLVAKRIFERYGYVVDIVGTGLEAIGALEKTPYDVIFMDVQMPELDGLEASKRIRERGASGRQPHIVAMTANAMDRDRRAAEEAGMNDYVTKPVTIASIEEALVRAYERVCEKA